jgi:hypothetical protein
VWHLTVRWRGLIALAAGAMLAAGLGQTSRGHAVLRAMGLLDEPTTYTSLAFLNPQSLPQQLEATRASVNASFVIHNANTTPSTYQWSVLLAQGRRTHRLAGGNVLVAPGHGAAISPSLEIDCTSGKVRIEVNLAHPAESIDVWLTCPPRRGRTVKERGVPKTKHRHLLP